MLLDMVEVAKTHTGANLAEAFAALLKELGIEDKVSYNLRNHTYNRLTSASL